MRAILAVLLLSVPAAADEPIYCDAAVCQALAAPYSPSRPDAVRLISQVDVDVAPGRVHVEAPGARVDVGPTPMVTAEPTCGREAPAVRAEAACGAERAVRTECTPQRSAQPAARRTCVSRIVERYVRENPEKVRAMVNAAGEQIRVEVNTRIRRGLLERMRRNAAARRAGYRPGTSVVVQ